MSFQKIKVEGVPLTLELAREFANLPELPGEREIRESRQEYLLRELRDGAFVGPNWARGIERGTKKIYRLDGQHSSKLLSNLPADTPFPINLLTTMDTFEFDSLAADGAALFNLFNHPKSARTNEDAVGIYRAQSPIELRNIDRAFLVKIGNGIAEYIRGLPDNSKKEPVHQPRQRGMYFTDATHKYSQFACWVATFREAKNSTFLSRGSIIAEMLSDWLIDADRGGEFWSYVLRENHPEVDHETRSLAETFRTWSLQKKYKPAQYRARANTAWKHYLKEIRSGAAA
jgi:hypothetical protein